MNLTYPTVDNDKICKDQIEMLQKKQHEYKLLGRIRKIPGHTLFSFNTETKEIKPADMVRCNTVHLMTRKPLKNDRVNIEPDCYYEQALNKKNFVKRLIRRGLL